MNQFRNILNILLLQRVTTCLFQDCQYIRKCRKQYQINVEQFYLDFLNIVLKNVMKYEHLITRMFFGIYCFLFEMVYHVGTVTEKDEHL